VELAPPRTACSRAGVGAGGCPRVTPGNLFLGFLMPNPAFGGNLGQKMNSSRVNLTSTTWSAGTLQC